MPIDPVEFLEFAEWLIGMDSGEHQEALYRTVVNRSYLACVLEAERILEPLVGSLPRDREFYTAVERGLISRAAPKSKNKLFDLRRRRRDADYTLDLSINRSYARESLAVASDLLSLLEQEVL